MLSRRNWALRVGKTIVFNSKMGIRKFRSAALPFSKVAYIVKGFFCLVLSVTDALSIILRLLGEELKEASWLINARSRMEPVKPCNE